MSGKQYKLPSQFHERVLDMELQIDKLKEKTPHYLLKELLSLYSVTFPSSPAQQAIEYYGSIDSEKSIDLNLRMQSILVRPYILKSLSDPTYRKNSGQAMSESSGEDEDEEEESGNEEEQEKSAEGEKQSVGAAFKRRLTIKDLENS